MRPARQQSVLPPMWFREPVGHVVALCARPPALARVQPPAPLPGKPQYNVTLVVQPRRRKKPKTLPAPAPVRAVPIDFEPGLPSTRSTLALFAGSIGLMVSVIIGAGVHERMAENLLRQEVLTTRPALPAYASNGERLKDWLKSVRDAMSDP